MTIQPATIPVPKGTTAMYITAISLFDKESTASIAWSDGASAMFGVDFVGPSSSYVLSESSGLPIYSVTPIPTEITVDFDFKDDMAHQHSASAPITKKVGRAGSASTVQISGYDSTDSKKKAKPTTVTILFQGKMPGLNPPKGSTSSS